MRYRKKPLEIEAWHYGEEATPKWGHVAFESGVLRLTPDGEAKVRTLEGSMTARTEFIENVKDGRYEDECEGCGSAVSLGIESVIGADAIRHGDIDPSWSGPTLER